MVLLSLEDDEGWQKENSDSYSPEKLAGFLFLLCSNKHIQIDKEPSESGSAGSPHYKEEIQFTED